MTNVISEKRKAILIHGSDDVSQFYREIADLCNLELTDYNPLKDERNKLLELYFGLERSDVEHFVKRMGSEGYTEQELLSVFRAADIGAVFVDDDSLGEKSLNYQLNAMQSKGSSQYQSLQSILSKGNNVPQRGFIPAIDIPQMFNLDERVMPTALQSLYLYITKRDVSSLFVQELLKQPHLGGPGYSWVFYGEKTTAQVVWEVVNKLQEIRKQSTAI